MGNIRACFAEAAGSRNEYWMFSSEFTTHSEQSVDVLTEFSDKVGNFYRPKGVESRLLAKPKLNWNKSPLGLEVRENTEFLKETLKVSTPPGMLSAARMLSTAYFARCPRAKERYRSTALRARHQTSR